MNGQLAPISLGQVQAPSRNRSRPIDLSGSANCGSAPSGGPTAKSAGRRRQGAGRPSCPPAKPMPAGRVGARPRRKWRRSNAHGGQLDAMEPASGAIVTQFSHTMRLNRSGNSATNSWELAVQRLRIAARSLARSLAHSQVSGSLAHPLVAGGCRPAGWPAWPQASRPGSAGIRWPPERPPQVPDRTRRERAPDKGERGKKIALRFESPDSARAGPAPSQLRNQASDF